MASMARGKSGAILSTCSSAVGRREYGGRGLRERWREAMFVLYQWVRERRWGSEGRGLISLSLVRGPFYSTPRDDVDGIPLPGPRRARFLLAPMCCLMKDSLSTLLGIGDDADA